MKILLASDIHVEFDGIESLKQTVKNLPEHDLLVIAGDLCPVAEAALYQEALNILSDSSPFVIYVYGNHEYYGASLDEVNEIVREYAFPNVKIATDYQKITLDNTTFHCGTMWFPNLPDTEGIFIGPKKLASWADFKHVVGGSPQVYDAINKAFKQKLQESFKPGDIVVTHHMPSYMETDPKYVGNIANRFFVGETPDGELTKFIIDNKPSLWLHGHTHILTHIKIGETLIIANPRGYPWEVKPYWEPLAV